MRNNNDETAVTRHKSHGETTLTGEATKAVESVAGGGREWYTIKGIKKDLGLDGEKKNK